ncbi:unnamed protein product [Ectocarpus sp. 12 AP-2014]
MDSTNALDSRSLLRINAHEESFLPVEMKVGWLSRQASMRSRASAMVGSRISQLDDAIRVRALLSILQSSSATTTPAARPETPPSGAGASSVAKIAQDSCSASEGEEGRRSRPKGKRHVRTDSGPPPDLQDLEVFARMAVAKIKVVLFQLASPAEVREREQQGKDVFDVYEGLLTSEALAKAAKEGFPTLDVETLMLPAHFRYRSLVAARHRYLLRKLGVLLDMEDGVDSLLEKAADTEKMDPSSLADVDLSAAEDVHKEGAADARTLSQEGASNHSAASALVLPSNAASAAALGGGTLDTAKKAVARLRRSTSWDKDEEGGEATTEGETDEENMSPPQAVHHRRLVQPVSPSR